MDNPINRMPFDPYDFFGYLTSGLIIIVGMDLTFGFPHILGRDLKVVESALLLIAVYVTGQIIATPAKAVLEDGLVGKVLGRPSINLFRKKKRCLDTILFPGYYQTFPSQKLKKSWKKLRTKASKGRAKTCFCMFAIAQVSYRIQS